MNIKNTKLREQFIEDTCNHIITVNLDTGLYRDITIHRQDTSDFHFNITTRPGYLFFSGDMGSFTFYRSPDMFEFFRTNGDIKPAYWAEKLEAVCKYAGATQFDYSKVKERLREYLDNYIEMLEDDIYEDDRVERIEEATNAVNHFCDCVDENEWSYVNEINDWSPEDSGGLTLDDFWELSVETYTHHYIWSLYAILLGIKLYDELKSL